MKKVASTPASYEQDADMFDDFFKSLPEESLLGGPPKPSADFSAQGLQIQSSTGMHI